MKSIFMRTLPLIAFFALLSMSILAGPLEDAKSAYEKEDYSTALRLWQALADAGNPQAQTGLASMYFAGDGVPQDYAEAVKWYRRAADQGDAAAQNSLGLMYAKGQGVRQDYVVAVMWYRIAADKGRYAAQINLGMMYEQGHGVAQNFVLAHKWYNLANAQEDLPPQFRAVTSALRDRVALRLTPRQLEQAQALAAEWRPQYNKGGTWVDSPDAGRKSLPSDYEIVSTGTGFFVSQQGHLLTNHHVIEGCNAVKFRLPGQSSRQAKPVAEDRSNDLALLRSETRIDSVAPFSSGRRPRLGQLAVIFGFPLTGVLSSSGNLVTGTVSALYGLQDDSRFFQISAPVQPGNSGGPVLDASGAVIGVVVGKLNARAVENAIADIPQNVNFAIKGALAAGFLDSNGVDYVTDSSNQTIPTEEIAKRAMRYTVLVECLK